MKHLCLPVLVLLAGTACAKDEGDDSSMLKDTGVADMGTPDSGLDLGFNAQEVAAALATAECAYLTRCVPEYYDAAGETEAQCVTEGTENRIAIFGDLAELIEADRLVYSESQKDACLQSFSTVDCVLGLPAGNACDRVFTGSQQVNEPCFFADECEPNLYCNRANGLGSCGACAQSPAKGAACDPFTPCVENAACLDIGQQAPDYRCIPVDAQEGGTCLTLETGLCQGNLNCIGDASSTCVLPGGSNATCDNDPMTFTLPECDLPAGFACNGSNCVDANWSDLNGPCNATTFCREDSYCNGGSCAALPGVGLSCMASGACGEDAFCDGTNCRPLLADAAACSASIECTGELFCLGAGLNRQGSCGVLAWQLCQ